MKLRKYVGVVACMLLPFVTGRAASEALKVGVTAGPHAMIMDKVKQLAQAQGLDVEVVEFNDFVLPNAALDQGELHINIFQHQPYLEEQIKTRGYKLVSVAKTVVMPLGMYALDVKHLHDLKLGAHIAIPNDPTNEGRALRLLERLGLIGLKPSSHPSVLDVDQNPRDLKITTLEAPQIPRVLKDVDAAIINTDWVLLSGIDPGRALAKEDQNCPYVNVMVVKQGQENHPLIQKCIALYQSDEVKEFIQQTFKGAILPAW